MVGLLWGLPEVVERLDKVRARIPQAPRAEDVRRSRGRLLRALLTGTDKLAVPELVRQALFTEELINLLDVVSLYVSQRRGDLHVARVRVVLGWLYQQVGVHPLPAPGWTRATRSNSAMTAAQLRT